jgi:signal transduction histidine kinase
MFPGGIPARILLCGLIGAAAGVELVGNIDGLLFSTMDGLNLCQHALHGACKVLIWPHFARVQLTALTYLVLLLLVFPLVARWCLQPITEFVPLVRHVGPQNLGQRIRPDARRSDVVATLARALDDMMDGLAAGYEAQRRFAANASHELRTPLAVQRTLIEVGMSVPLTQQQVTLLAVQLLQANERNEKLIEGMLVLSEADRGLVANQPCRLDELAAKVVVHHQAAAAGAGITITTDLRPRIVNGEDVLLERLVTNLVQNAIKYNYAGGSLHVTVGVSPALTVVNTGQEVPAAAVSSLFEPFKRLTTDRIEHSGGAGLGLAIVRSITQAHHGTVSAAPAARGGLLVQVDFPLRHHA